MNTMRMTVRLAALPECQASMPSACCCPKTLLCKDARDTIQQRAASPLAVVIVLRPAKRAGLKPSLGLTKHGCAAVDQLSKWLEPCALHHILVLQVLLQVVLVQVTGMLTGQQNSSTQTIYAYQRIQYLVKSTPSTAVHEF